MSLRVLVVEDEPKVLKFIKSGLEASDVIVDTCSEFSLLNESLSQHRYDVIVLDRMMQGYDTAFDLKRIRDQAPTAGILILSALGQPEDRIQGLNSGADDYLAKPFHVRELIARVRALSRRPATPFDSNVSDVISIEGLQIDLKNQTVERKGQKIELSMKEFKLIALLAKDPDRIHSKTELLEAVWGSKNDPFSNLVEVAIARLRSKINFDESTPLIVSRRGGGYYLGPKH